MEEGQLEEELTPENVDPPKTQSFAVKISNGIGFIEGFLLALFGWPIGTLDAINELIGIIREKEKKLVIILYYLLVILLPLSLVPVFLLWLVGMGINIENFLKMVFFELFLSILFFALVWIATMAYSFFSSIVTSSLVKEEESIAEEYEKVKKVLGFGIFVLLALVFLVALPITELLVKSTLTTSLNMLVLITINLLLGAAVIAGVVTNYST